MMKVSLIIATAALTVAVSAAAQVSAAERPPLLSDTTVKAEDSELVRAAKIAVALRRGSATTMIDDNYMQHTFGRISEATGPAMMPISVGGTRTAIDHSSSFAPLPPAVDQAAVQQKIENLRQEQQRMNAETLEPYGGDVNEDYANRRVTEIPKEMNQLQTPPPPPPPPQ